MRTEIKKYVLSVLAIIAFGQMPVLADKPIQKECVGRVIIVNIMVHPRTELPDCYYYNGSVYIECSDTVTGIACTVTRFEHNSQWSSRVAGNTLQVLTSSDSGLYGVTFTLADGSSFYGEFQIP